jgi:very-short-patch-repair endonuclease
LTEEHKINIGKAISGKRNGMFGVHRFGKTAPHYGKPHTERTKRKMRQHHWSRTNPSYFKEINKKQRPRNPTPYEDLLANELGRRQETFIRQFSVSPYCCDFYFPKQNLIVEVDGYRKSNKRTKYILSKGYKLLHIKNEALTNMKKVMEFIYANWN